MRTSVRAFRAVLHHHDNVPDVRMDERLESPPAAVGGPWSCRDYDGSKEARSSQLQAGYRELRCRLYCLRQLRSSSGLRVLHNIEMPPEPNEDVSICG